AATLFCNGLVVYGVLMIVLALSGTGTNSAYNLYYNDDVPLLTQQELGVAPAMAMDLCRTVFGFSPKDDSFVSDPAEIKDLLAVDQAKPQPQPIVYPPNALPIDFDALMASTQDTELGDMHHYFSVVPPTLQNSYTGIFADCNLIYIVAEGFSQYLLNPTLCPTLYRLSSEGLQFTNFYTALWNVSTSDGEYVACTGLVPKSGCWSFSKSADNYLPFCLGNQFSQQGYATPRAYHNNTYTYYDRDQSHPNMGYIYHGLGNGLNVRQDWPESDLEMMELSIPEYIHEDRFHAYYMTVSGHLQYNFSGNVQARKHQAQVADLPYSEEAKAYIACNLELEQAMKYLLDQLEAANKLDNTVIVLSADHYPYGLSKQTIDEFAGHPVDENFELYRNGLIIWKSGMAHQVIEDPGSSMDILPTVSNLFGLPYDSRLLMGRDLFSTSSPLVIFNNRSWITDQASYNAATGVYSGTVGQEYLDAINKIVANKVHYAAQILDKDYYAIVFGQKQQ
ncbi:MAG: LTA synthase family protein, partial [Clostridiales bacterium]